MKHIKAQDVLPQSLIKEIQKYIKGQYVYIPESTGARRSWGEKKGSRQVLQERNKEIQLKFEAGCKVSQLADSYYLSIASIKKIVYQSK